jgi:hypothetical protein
MRLKTLVVPIILLAVAACGEGDDIPLEKGPFLRNDRNELLFDMEFCSGTYIGASTFNSLYIENGGDETLEITEVTKTGAREFTMQLPADISPATPLRLESRKRTFIEVKFTPPTTSRGQPLPADCSPQNLQLDKGELYKGKLTIKSNAANAAEKEINLLGRGVTPP